MLEPVLCSQPLLPKIQLLFTPAADPARVSPLLPSCMWERAWGSVQDTSWRLPLGMDLLHLTWKS